MSYKNTNLSVQQLIRFGKNGITVATYQETRAAIVEVFRNIYGKDIDISSASADGVYVETLSLMISNMLQSFKQFYSQLDINTASGKFLEMLCALSNVRRKPASFSIANVEITLSNTETENYTMPDRVITLIDKSGLTWSYTSDEDIVFQPGITKVFAVQCEKIGPVSAPKGWIDNIIDNEKTFTVVQAEDAELGSYSESDSSLRNRRNASLGSTGNTVLEAMIGELYQLKAITDVIIYNNDGTGNVDSTGILTAADTTKISLHDIYVVIRRRQNVELDDADVAYAIREKLTPGIKTTQTTVNNSKKFEYMQNIGGTEVSQMIYWKEAVPSTEIITIAIQPYATYSKTNSSSNTSTLIAQAVLDYINNLPLSSSISRDDIWNVVNNIDPMFRGQKTYKINVIGFKAPDSGTRVNNYLLPDTYFDYTLNDVTITDNDTSIVIQIGGK